MTNVSWNFVGSKKKYNSNELLRVKPDCNLKVRLLGRPAKVVKIFTNDNRCINLDNEEVGQQLKAKYPQKLGSPSTRYACWCINREDNSLKILDMPMTLARAFGNREALIGSKIAGSEEGCDWKITTNGRKGKDVRYEAVFLEETPLSETEKQMVEYRKSEKDGYFDLTKIFKSCSFDEAEEKVLESA